VLLLQFWNVWVVIEMGIRIAHLDLVPIERQIDPCRDSLHESAKFGELVLKIFTIFVKCKYPQHILCLVRDTYKLVQYLHL